MPNTWLARRRSLADALRHHPITGRFVAAALWLRTRLKRQTPTERLVTLARAAHLCPTSPAFDSLCRELRAELDRLDPAEIDWGRLGKPPADPCDVPKGVLLKPPQPGGEKGVLHVPFEDQWLRLFRPGQQDRVAELAADYDLILGPSWSPPPEPALLMAVKFWPGRLYTLLSNHADAVRMRAISEKLVPIPLLASSWADPAAFAPHLGQARDLDVVMLANFAPFKRHWLLFDALRTLPRSYRVLLLGVPLGGRNETDLRREAERFGVGDRFDVIVRPSRDDVARNLARARVSLILSKREGSCVAVAESLFADTPVGLVHGAHVGSTAYINDRTGRMLREGNLAEDVQAFVAEAHTYRPRTWALAHISYRHSTAVLNHLFREQARRDGRPWTRDLEPFAQDLVSIYPAPERAQAMQPHIDAFEARFGLRLGRGMRATSPARQLAAVA